MNRSSRHALAFAMMMAMTGPAAAVSVSNMVAWSAPGQPLRMDIELSELGAVRASEITVRVASAADHNRLGLTRPEWADSVSFRMLSVDGRAIARASGRQPVSENAVNFLVEIQALGQGSLQQVASGLSGSPLASPSAAPVPSYRPSAEASTFADRPQPKPKPKPRPKPKPAPVVEAAPEPAPAAAPAPAPAAAPVAAAAAPAAAPAVAATATDAVDAALLADASATGATTAAPGATVPVESIDSVEAVEQERAVIQMQLQDAQGQVTQLESRLQDLDRRLAELKGEPLPEAAAAEEVAAEPAAADAAAALPVDAAPGAAPYEVFTRVMVFFIALILLGVFGVGHFLERRKSAR